MDNILEVNEVSKAYSSHLALDRVSLQVPRGSVYGLLGPNGAGKTTLIRIINHITAPDSGTVSLDGRPLTADDVTRIGYLPEERGLYKKMKVGEQAVFLAQLKGLSRREATARLREWFGRFGIQDWWGKKVEELSKGMAQKVQFIVTVLHQPRLLIFDEPFSGFDPINANLLKDEILRLRDQGSTVIFSTHNMASVEEICDHITLINRSRNVLSGRVDELRRRYFEGCYDLEFAAGHPQGEARMMERLASIAAVEDKKLEGERWRMSLRLLPGAEARQLVAAANDNVPLLAFGETVASMSDLFIKAVSNDEREKKTEDE